MILALDESDDLSCVHLRPLHVRFTSLIAHSELGSQPISADHLATLLGGRFT